jgi:cytochrome b561
MNGTPFSPLGPSGPGTAADAPTRYDNLSIALHWATAAIILLQFALAETWEFFPKIVRHLLIVGHMSLGLMLAVVIALRILWRVLPWRQVFAHGQDFFGRAAQAMHRLLYVLIAAEVILGILTRWTDNQALSFFGLLIASPFGSVSKAVGGFVEEVHDVTAWTIIILAGAHALAALYHHYLLKDGILRRMMPWIT